MNELKILAPMAGLIFFPSAFCASYTLAPEADARIITVGPSYETVNFEDDILSVFTSGGNRQRTLMRFDLSPVMLNPGERLSSATLVLYASTSYGGSAGVPMDLYRVVSDWDEASVTWRNRKTDTPWLQYGSDFVGHGTRQPFASSSASPANLEPVTWDITDLVDQWVEQVIPNHGLLLMSSQGNALTFVQHEFPQETLHPRLEITTEIGPPRLKVELNRATGEVLLSWRGAGVAALEENPDIGSSAAWSNSPATVSSEKDSSRAAVPITDSIRYFRLRGTP
jgi:hypothetical protein